MTKRILCLIIAAVLLFLLCGCLPDHVDQEEIVTFVQENREMILADIAEEDYTDTLAFDLVESVETSEHCVSFYCGGYGLSVSSHDFGFYYSFDGQPLGIWMHHEFCQSDQLTPEGDGYSGDMSGNVYYTERICDNLWYCEIHF